MSFNSTIAGLQSTAFLLPGIDVPIFNLARYVLMTYLLGFLWDVAHVRLIETKRYISLWHTGHFSVATWGRSRNNLFCGSNFETFLSAIRRRFSTSTVEAEDDDDPGLSSMGRFSVRCGLIEVAIIVLIIIVAFAETASELYTSSTLKPFHEFRNMTSLVRQTTSEVIFNDSYRYSETTDITFARRCATYQEDGKKYVTLPNLIVKRGRFNASLGEIPTYDMDKLCFYDRRHEMNTTLIESQEKENTSAYEFNGVLHTEFKLKILENIAVPHFSSISLSKEELRRDSRLVLVSLDDRLYTCTKIYTWCVRVDKNAYEVLFPSYSAELQENYRHNKSYFLFDFQYTNAVPFLLPFRISFDTLPLLAKDRFMMRPRQRGGYISDIEENLSMLAIGYTYGWATEEMRPQRVIFQMKNRIVPTVEVGYIASVCTIVLCSCLIFFVHEFASRNRKITGLVGEHAFIDRWHVQLERVGKCHKTLGRAQLIVCRSPEGAVHIQPSCTSNPCPLSEIEKIN